MVTAPTWQAPTTLQPPLAAQVNQLLGPHGLVVIYQGTQTAAQTTNSGTTVSTNGTWLAQSFATSASQTSIGSVSLTLTTTTTTGSLLSPTTVSIYANSGGAPTGSPLVSTTFTTEYSNKSSLGTSTNFVGVPVPVSSVTPSTTYWIVVGSAGNASNSFVWHQSNQTSGASTSPDGVTWTAQTYGFTYTVMDLSVSPPLKSTWEDGGARWTWFVYDGTQKLTHYHEYTVGQTTAGYLQSDRAITYGGTSITGVS